MVIRCHLSANGYAIWSLVGSTIAIACTSKHSNGQCELTKTGGTVWLICGGLGNVQWNVRRIVREELVKLAPSEHFTPMPQFLDRNRNERPQDARNPVRFDWPKDWYQFMQQNLDQPVGTWVQEKLLERIDIYPESPLSEKRRPGRPHRAA